MKRIFLSEGKNDAEFLSLFIDEHYPSLQKDRLDMSNEDGGSIVGRESEKIRRFKEPRNSYDVLIKSENGDENLLSVLGSKLPELLRDDLELYVLIDLDGDSISSRITQFESQLQPHTPGRRFTISCEEELVRTHYLETYVINVQNGGRYIGKFKLLAFCEDLEDAANITEDETDRDVIESKIENILRRNQVTAPIQAALSD